MFANALEQAGAKIVVEPIPRLTWSRWRLFRAARTFDLVFLQRHLFPPWDVLLLRRGARRLVFDFDDALWLRDRAPFRSFTRRQRFSAVVGRADFWIAGNDDLFAQARAIRAEGCIIPTCVSAPPAALVSENDSRAPCLLWVGQPSTFRYLEPLHSLLEEMVERFGARVVLVGASSTQARAFGFAEPHPWSLAFENGAWIETLGRDVLGLAPLDDDCWTRGKCGLRLLKYLSRGIPALAAKVGSQERIGLNVRGVTLVENGSGWRAGLEGFCETVRRGGSLDRPRVEDVMRVYGSDRWATRFVRAVLGDQGGSRLQGEVSGGVAIRDPGR